MNKQILPMLATAALLAAAPAQAQMMPQHHPFDTFFDTMVFNPPHFEMRSNMEPRMDIADLNDKIEVKAELPGIDEKDINLSVEDGILTLSGERKTEVTEQDKNYYLHETSSGSFSRSVRLPKNIDESKISATFQKGILTVIIPKTEVKEDTTKKIPIKALD